MSNTRSRVKPSVPAQNYILGGNTLAIGGSIAQHSTHVNIGHRGGFDRLQEAVASAAFHNSAQRIDPPKCHPNTRLAVLHKIMEWIQNSENRDAWIMWLNVLQGRGNPTRNSVEPLIATLAYQLALTFPDTQHLISRAIDRDPLVFETSFESQLSSLIIEPLREIRSLSDGSNNVAPPFLIIIDGLDECDGREVQINIIYTIADALRDKDLPILFLITSRPEKQITMAFNSRKVPNLLERLPLDDTYLPDKDIRLFLNDKFVEIKMSHPFKHLIDPSWPTEDILNGLVEKSSGQFIYASVVMKFVSSSRRHPVQRLEVIQGIRPPRLDTPFAQLDALYIHIFSCVEDINSTMLVLSYAILGSFKTIPSIELFLSLAIGDIEVALADLTSIVVIESSSIKFLHASLPDFLLDPARSQKYYIDPPDRYADFAHRWFEHVKTGQSAALWGRGDAIHEHLKAAVPTKELHQDLLQFLPHPKHFAYLAQEDTVRILSKFLSSIKILDFQDEYRAYNQQLELITHMAKEHYPKHCHLLGEDHDISKILIKIESEQRGYEEGEREQQEACEREVREQEAHEQHARKHEVCTQKAREQHASEEEVREQQVRENRSQALVAQERDAKEARPRPTFQKRRLFAKWFPKGLRMYLTARKN
ncbi:hypothetical protein BDZ97DRAFT_1928995 [Flammula alnicola]|nr:hypothetical protein BDZ97DRAFT_1928995 [Flammula alnicola]